MNETYKPGVEQTSPAEHSITKETLYQMARQKFAYIFSKYPTGPERVAGLIEDNHEDIEKLENKENITEQLAACADIDERDKFIEAVFKILKPLVDNLFDEHQKVSSNPEAQFFVANELLTYDMKGDKLFIHVFSGGLDGSLAKYTQGLSAIAKVLHAYPQITSIEAWSWIVAKHPKILERLGFTVEQDEEGKPVVFNDEQGHASMPRAAFLKKYLTK